MKMERKMKKRLYNILFLKNVLKLQIQVIKEVEKVADAGRKVDEEEVKKYSTNKIN
jgi:predicted transcriptional regulator